MTKALSSDGKKQSRDAAGQDGDAPVRREWASIASRRISPRALLTTTLLLLVTQNLLLWRFLDFAPIWLYPLAILCFAVVGLFMTRVATAIPWSGPTVRTVLLLLAVSALIFLLGGEGRLFYANADWQIRDAVLHDLTVNEWPFVYRQDGTWELLRAPLGMFLIPALAGKALGPAAADIVLLAQNSLLLTLLLGLGSTLFASGRGRIAALGVIVLFSGMDVIGQLLRSAATGESLPDHLERWAGSQFSSHLTQAFWVPQHALAGWLGALLFLLWRERRISLGQMYAPLPMLMLMSPLGVMGMLPFAAFAGIATLVKRQLRPSDFLLPAATTLLCVPAIIYLGAAGGSVGIYFLALEPAAYLFFETLEMLVVVAGVALLNRGDGHERATLILVTACLMLVPFGQLGEGMDFTMRVSIPALAILSVQAAWALTRPPTNTGNRAARILLLSALAIGSITGMFEVARAIRFQASPRIRCNLVAADHAAIDLPKFTSNATYFAPVTAIPALLRPPAPSVVPPDDGSACWNRPWMTSRFK